MPRTSTVDIPRRSILLLVLERHLAAENAHRLDDTLATLTDDAVFVDQALTMTWTGRSGAATHYRMWWNAFDIAVTGERLHVARSSAVAETTWRGTHLGEFAGIGPTGRAVELPIVVIVEFRDGLIAGERFYWDRAVLAEQLGVDPQALRPSRAAVGAS